MPEVGNEHVATVVQSDTIFAAGLFNGDALATQARSTYRARIPAFIAEVSQASSSGVRVMDFERAVFIQRRNVTFAADGAVVTVEEYWYAPYQEPRLLAHEIAISLIGGTVGAEYNVSLSSAPTRPSSDLELHPIHGATAREYAVSGNNTIPDLGAPTEVGYAANILPPSVLLTTNTPARTLHALAAIVTSLNSTHVGSDALTTLRAALVPESIATLRAAHEAAWKARSANGRIEVEGELALALALNASLYFIRASIRPDWPYGLSPGGLASNGCVCLDSNPSQEVFYHVLPSRRVDLWWLAQWLAVHWATVGHFHVRGALRHTVATPEATLHSRKSKLHST